MSGNDSDSSAGNMGKVFGNLVEAPTWNDEDKVELPVQDFLEFIQSYKSLDFRTLPKPPTNFFIQQLKIEGEASSQEFVTFSCQFEVVMLVDAWTKCELLPSDVTVHSYEINYQEMVSSSGQKNSSLASTAFNSNGIIGVVGNSHCLISTKKGLFTVKLEISVPYMSKERKGCSFTFKNYSLKNYLQFKVANQNVRVQVEPSLETKLVRSGVSTDGSKDKQSMSQQSGTTIVESVFPPTSNICIYWTKIEPDLIKKDTSKIEKVKEQRPLTVNVDQSTLHSIGGGVISTATQLNYEIQNGTINHLYVLVTVPKSGKKFRILRAEGMFIKQWDYKEYKTSGNPGDQSSTSSVSESSFANAIGAIRRPEEANEERYLIKVILECGIENNYQLKIFCEMEMESASCKLLVPNLSCVSVNREKGNIAIEATSSIEIQEIFARQLTKLDVRELPTTLSNRAANPLLLGYKFLQSQTTRLKLNIIKHDDVAVLVAVIEEGLFRATQQDGLLLHQALLKVRNTSQDFLRMKLPENSSLWSTCVEGETVRPSKDKDGRILIPLKRSSSESVFVVEIFYLAHSVKMIGSGKLDLMFCTFNVPINQAYYELYLPTNCKYGEFEGDLQEVPFFKKSPTVESILNNNRSDNYRNINPMMNAMPQMQQQVQQVQQQQQQQQYMQQTRRRTQMQPLGSNSIFNSQSGDDDDDEDEQNMYDSASEGEDDENENFGNRAGDGTIHLSSSMTGVLPVKLNPLKVGKPFLFERGLLSEKEEALKLCVPFTEQEAMVKEKTSISLEAIHFEYYFWFYPLPCNVYFQAQISLVTRIKYANLFMLHT